MKRIAPIILLLVVFCCGRGETSAQCDCGYGNPDLAAYLADRDFKLADVVFIGKVTEIERARSVDNDYDIVVTFAVSRAWKRDLKERVTLRNFEGCDRGYKLGGEWLVYAYDRSDGAFRIDCCCSGTKLLSRADADLKTFEEKGKKPAKILKARSKASAQPNKAMQPGAPHDSYHKF
ncbi:MAG TPA: hypothetical protein VGV59_18240 [Pyrinomonadaceae bacterium]|nr:hypothetical protein [Pyrinomonadaceae bacterium]